MNSDTIHIALTLCDPYGTYSRHVAVTVASIIENTGRKLNFHIVHDDTLTKHNKYLLGKMSVPERVQIDFVNVEEVYKAASLKISRRNVNISRAMYFRLFLQDVISESKIIYLDCDIVVDIDIAELWNIDLHGSAIAAVRDVATYDYIDTGKTGWRAARLYNLLKIDMSRYFNGGVLVMDLAKIRRCYNFRSEVISFYSKYGKVTTFGNQDCLNYIFGSDCLLIDEKFNWIRTKPDSEFRAIWHMAGNIKPWETYSRQGMDELYWKYLLKTPYIDSVDSLIKTMLRDLSTSKYTHLHSNDCVKRLYGQLMDNVLHGHMYTVPRILILQIARLFEKGSN